MSTRGRNRHHPDERDLGEERGTARSGESPEALLPFVGRKKESALLERYVRDGNITEHLTIFWIEGEAGLGKSRLVAEMLRPFESTLLIIHARFHADSPSSLSEALRSAVSEAADRAAIPVTLSSDGVTGLLPALRTLIRRTQTLLVIEDIHLLEKESIAELALLFHSLEREPLAIVCTARPGNSSAFGLALPFLYTAIKLSPLSQDEVEELGRRYGYHPVRHENLTRLILERTDGIPLALWTVYRSILSRRSAISEHPVAAVRRLAEDFATSLLVGLSRDLSDEDREKGTLLALAGEVFAVGVIEQMMEGAGEVIDRLESAGILAPCLYDPLPVVEADSELQDQARMTDRSLQLYTFSHTLLHEQILEQKPEALPGLGAILMSGLPLYSILPIIHGSFSDCSFDSVDDIRPFIERVCSLIQSFNDSPYWKGGEHLLRELRDLFERHRQLFTEEEYREELIDLLILQCEVYNAFTRQDEFREPVRQLLQLTAHPQTGRQRLQRLRTLRFALFYSDDAWTFPTQTTLAEARAIIALSPDLLLDPTTLILFGTIGSAIRVSGSFQEVRDFRQTLQEMLQEARRQDDIETEHEVLCRIAPNLLSTFESEEELEDRRELASEILAACRGGSPEGMMVTAWPRFLEIIGEAKQAAEVLDDLMPPNLSGYDLARQVALRLLKITVRAALGDPADDMFRMAAQLLEEFNQVQWVGDAAGPSYARLAVATHLILAGVMRGEIRDFFEEAVRLCGNDAAIRDYMPLERAILERDRETVLHWLDQTGRAGERFGSPSLLESIRSPETFDDAAVSSELAHAFRTSIIQRQDLVLIRIVVALVEMVREESPGTDMPETMKIILPRILEAARWTRQHRLAGYAPPLLRLVEAYAPQRDPQEAHENDAAVRIGEREEGMEEKGIDEEKKIGEEEDAGGVTEKKEEGEGQREEKVGISMIGTILTRLPGEGGKKVRGSRIQQLLGGLTANHLTGTRLTLEEFRLMVTGIEDPEENANYLRILTSRLRKSIGAEAILTDGEHPPRFNLSRVEVDLIDASSSLNEAIRLAGINNGGAAARMLEETFELVAEGKIYPGLEGDFFDAARSEFADRLRDAVISIADLMRREGGEERGKELADRGRQVLGLL